jgi:hypothetical protein
MEGRRATVGEREGWRKLKKLSGEKNQEST